MDYRVGAFGWKFAARAGASLVTTVKIIRDDEAGVYVATSDDLKGLVLEAATLDELRAEVLAAAPVLLEMQLSAVTMPRLSTEFRLFDTAPCAA